eukprot:GHVL01022579.1.p1 GENE.GHVL01022579.1~~GHVL01022579.1.p1  ORF type:complete len:476 (+),score=59.23 GHVL01022579.1:4056-5483(+)
MLSQDCVMWLQNNCPILHGRISLSTLSDKRQTSSNPNNPPVNQKRKERYSMPPEVVENSRKRLRRVDTNFMSSITKMCDSYLSTRNQLCVLADDVNTITKIWLESADDIDNFVNSRPTHIFCFLLVESQKDEHHYCVSDGHQYFLYCTSLRKARELIVSCAEYAAKNSFCHLVVAGEWTGVGLLECLLKWEMDHRAICSIQIDCLQLIAQTLMTNVHDEERKIRNIPNDDTLNRSWILMNLYNKMSRKLAMSPKSLLVHYNLLRRCQYSTSEMHWGGIPFNGDLLQEQVNEWEKQCRAIEQKSFKQFGFSMNLRSTKQISDFIKAKLSSESIQKWPRSAGGAQLKTDASTLKEVSRESLPSSVVNVVKTLLEFREYDKKLSMYGAYGSHCVNGRLHPYYKLGGAVTGRFSASSPNIHGALRTSQFRGLFRSPPRRKLIIADFSQIELRVVGEVSKDNVMRDVFSRYVLYCEESSQ